MCALCSVCVCEREREIEREREMEMSTLMGRREDAGYHDGLDQILSNTGSLQYYIYHCAYTYYCMYYTRRESLVKFSLDFSIFWQNLRLHSRNSRFR